MIYVKVRHTEEEIANCRNTYKVGVTGVDDAHNTNSVELSGSSSELNVRTLVVVHRSLGAMMPNTCKRMPED